MPPVTAGNCSVSTAGVATKLALARWQLAAWGAAPEVGPQCLEHLPVHARDREQHLVGGLADPVDAPQRLEKGASGHRADAYDVIEGGTKAPRLPDALAGAVRESMRLVAGPRQKKRGVLFEGEGSVSGRVDRRGRPDHRASCVRDPPPLFSTFGRGGHRMSVPAVALWLHGEYFGPVEYQGAHPLRRVARSGRRCRPLVVLAFPGYPGMTFSLASATMGSSCNPRSRAAASATLSCPRPPSTTNRSGDPSRSSRIPSSSASLSLRPLRPVPRLVRGESDAPTLRTWRRSRPLRQPFARGRCGSAFCRAPRRTGRRSPPRCRCPRGARCRSTRCGAASSAAAAVSESAPAALHIVGRAPFLRKACSALSFAMPSRRRADRAEGPRPRIACRAARRATPPPIGAVVAGTMTRRG